MKVEQIYAIVNETTKEFLGTDAVVAEDLSNIVDIGEAVFNVTNVENFSKKLVDAIGKMVFVNRKYTGVAPSVYMDSWEYGSVVCKATVDKLPEATENQSWSLINGKVYDQQKFYGTDVNTTFYDSKVSYEIAKSFTELQLKSAFHSATELNSFLSMIETSVENSITVKTQSMILSTITNMIAETISTVGITESALAASVGNTKVVNLLKMYNTEMSTTLTRAQAITNPEFLRFASSIINLYPDRLKSLSTLFNFSGVERFTTSEKLHTIFNSEFQNKMYMYLNSDTYHDEYVNLPNAETISFWQGSGTSYTFDDCTRINVTVKNPAGGDAITVVTSGIIGVMFDHDACGVTNANQRVTSAYNAEGEFVNNYYKVDAAYFNDLKENCVVFVIA